jgi:hypothetical protein
MCTLDPVRITQLQQCFRYYECFADCDSKTAKTSKTPTRTLSNCLLTSRCQIRWAPAARVM